MPAPEPDPNAEPPARLITVPFALVTCATFAYFICLGALLPIVPRYVEDELGGGGLEVGLAVGAFAVSAALLRPWVGRLGDAYGRRVLVIGGSLVVGLSVLGYSFASTLAVLVLLRLATGIGEAGMWIGAATSIQDMAPPDRRGEAASYFSVALYLGLAVGPFVGERLLATSGGGNFTAVWIAAGASALVATLFGTRTPAGRPPPVPRTRKLLHPASIGPGLVLLLGMIPFAGFSAFLPLYGEEIGLDDVGPVFALYAGTVILVRVFGARLPDRLGWQVASAAALTSVGAASAVMAAWHASGAVWVAAVLMALGMSLLFPALFSAVVNAAPEQERSQAVGTFSLFFDLSTGLGAPALGLVVQLTSYRGGFLAAALLAACGFLAMRSLHQRALATDESVATADTTVAEAGEGAGAPVWTPRPHEAPASEP